MQPDSLSIAVRPRQQWEAVDLGVLMVRTWWRQVYGAWLLTVLPLMVVVSLLCWQADGPWLAGILGWWGKPLLDRVPLYVLSHGVFGETPGIAQTMRAIPSLLRMAPLWRMLLRRFSLTRSFDLPVLQLEGLPGKERKARTRVLQKGGGSAATWLTLACLHFELALELSLFVLVWLFLPQQFQFDFMRGFFTQEWPGWFDWMANIFWFSAMLVVEPIYVAGGFGLYLNRRTQLEGWDIELAFRALARRAERQQASHGAGLAAGLMLVLALSMHAPEGQAAEATVSKERAKEQITQVLRDPLFKTTETVSNWRYVGKKDSGSREPSAFARWMEQFGVVLAWLFKGAMWLGLIAAIVWLVLNHKRWLGWFRKSPQAPVYVAPQELFGLDLRPESFPDDIPAEALRLWQAGEPRLALGLLYRGALAHLIATDGIELRESDTEGDCVRQVAASGVRTKAGFFGQLTSAWERAAYAGRPPDMEQGRLLCADWPQHFGKPA